MAAYFTLTPRHDDAQHGPMSLMHIDEGFCQLLGVPVDPDKYVASWYDVIGFSLAMGQSIEQLRRRFISEMAEDMRNDTDFKYWNRTAAWLVILQSIDDNYLVNCWAGR